MVRQGAGSSQRHDLSLATGVVQRVLDVDDRRRAPRVEHDYPTHLVSVMGDTLRAVR